MKRLLAALIVVPIQVLPASWYLSASNDDAVVVRVATHLVRSESFLSNLWPDFWTSSYVFGLFPVAGGTMVIHPKGGRPTGTIPAPAGSIPSQLEERVSFVPNRVGSFVFDFEFRLGAQPIPAFSPTGTMIQQRGPSANRRWTADTVASFVHFVIHESFHAFQMKRFAPLPSQSSAFANASPTRPHRALVSAPPVDSMLEAERTLLAAAVEAPICATALASVNRYRLQREARLSVMPALFAAYENAHERAEGLATWVGLVGVYGVMTNDSLGAFREVVADLREPYRDTHGIPFTGWTRFASWHLYATGAAKAALLTRCGPADWETRAANGQDLQSLIDDLVTSLPPYSDRMQ